MNRPSWILFLAVFTLAMPSWGQSDSVIQDGKEWLQPADFIEYTYDDVNAVCPAGVCSGALPASSFDLTGYIWASAEDVSGLFNAYGVLPPFTAPFTENDSRVSQLGVIRAIFDDFESTTTRAMVIFAMLRDYVPAANEIAVASVAPEILTLSYGFNFPVPNSIPPGAWFWKPLSADLILHLEEPVNAETHSGIGNLRGWAIAEDGIDRVEIYIDDKYVYDAPYGGSRSDVGEAYPDVEGAENSGYSLAFGYSNLADGEHTIKARAVDLNGDFVEDTSTFTVVGFDEPFIFSNEIVDVSDSAISAEGDEIFILDVTIGEKVYDLKLKWRNAEQGFEIIEIR